MCMWLISHWFSINHYEAQMNETHSLSNKMCHHSQMFSCVRSYKWCLEGIAPVACHVTSEHLESSPVKAAHGDAHSINNHYLVFFRLLRHLKCWVLTGDAGKNVAYWSGHGIKQRCPLPVRMGLILTECGSCPPLRWPGHRSACLWELIATV